MADKIVLLEAWLRQGCDELHGCETRLRSSLLSTRRCCAGVILRSICINASVCFGRERDSATENIGGRNKGGERT